MKRKDFISSIIPLGAALSSMAAGKEEPDGAVKIPPYLKMGDTIGITCPAGFITLLEIQPAILKLKEWGFTVTIGATVGKKDFTFGGTDEERLKDFQQMLDDKNIKPSFVPGVVTVRLGLLMGLILSSFPKAQNGLLVLVMLRFYTAILTEIMALLRCIQKCAIAFQMIGI